MWQDGFDTAGSKRSQNRDQQDPDFGGLWTVTLAVALAVFFASALPQPLFAVVMSELLILSAVGSLVVAVLRQDKVFVPAITAWDQAAILVFLGLVCRFFIDDQAVAETLDQMIGTAGRARA